MKEIKYVKGDATNPSGEGLKIICHVCNDVGGWGRGFVLALSKKWKDPENSYRKWSRKSASMCVSTDDMFRLGNIQFVPVEEDLMVANMIGQHDIRWKNGEPPVRYDAIEKCLIKVAQYAKENNASVVCPRFGAGLAGGDWSTIEDIIIKNLCENDIDVTVYDLK